MNSSLSVFPLCVADGMQNNTTHARFPSSMAGQFSGVAKRTVDIFQWSQTLATSSMLKMQKGQVQLRHTGRKREGRRGEG